MRMIIVDDVARLRYTTVEVAARAQVDAGTVRRDIHRKNIQAEKIARDYQFTHGQFLAAVKYYRDKKRREKRNAADHGRAAANETA